MVTPLGFRNLVDFMLYISSGPYLYPFCYDKGVIVSTVLYEFCDLFQCGIKLQVVVETLKFLTR
jgi:hypothetical protein